MSHFYSFRLLQFIALAVISAVALAVPRPAGAQVTFEELHTLPSCSSIRTLFSALVEGTDGNFYGTTDVESGVGGTVLRLTPSGSVTALHTFTGGTTDGSNPRAALIQASDGNFYGTTFAGGTANMGTVFRMTPAGVVTIMHSFIGGNVDGVNPAAALIQATDGNLYGTTTSGPPNSAGRGTVFRMTLAGSVTLVHTFLGGAGGASPTTLIQATDGNFYGMTSQGGANNAGTVFRLTPAGAKTVLYGSFAGITIIGSRFSGSLPGGDLIQGPDGNFFGTIHNHESPMPVFGGIIFKLTPAGALTNFVGLPGQSAPGLLVAGDGNFYGIAYRAAISLSNPNQLNIFRVTPDGTGPALLHTVDPTNCTGRPAPMVQASSGRFYGITAGGVVFRLTLPVTIRSATIPTVVSRTAAFTVATPSAFLARPTNGRSRRTTAPCGGDCRRWRIQWRHDVHAARHARHDWLQRATSSARSSPTRVERQRRMLRRSSSDAESAATCMATASRILSSSGLAAPIGSHGIRRPNT